ncbi:hypothetical protein AMJ87_09500, partial [candidate division WOR_3 bacterium SM23_60]
LERFECWRLGTDDLSGAGKYEEENTQQEERSFHAVHYTEMRLVFNSHLIHDGITSSRYLLFE